MDVEIITIGDEIISGHTIDTNSPFIAGKLMEIGLPVVYKTAVGDDAKKMEEVFYLALKRADIVITTGGLGPTDDDITKRAIVKVFKRNLVFHEEVLEDIRKRFAARGIEMPSINQNQALLPQGAIYLPNRIGSAVGIVINDGGKIFISLPGVPREMQVIASEEMIPYLESHISKQFIRTIKLRTTGIIESALAEKITPYIKLSETIHLAYLPAYGGVDLRIMTYGTDGDEVSKAAEELAEKLRGLVGKYIYGENNDCLEGVIGRLLKERGAKLATAESCTAGLLAARITDIPGSSAYFDRGVVTYSNRSKIELLDIPAEIIDRFGAVSAETAEAMAVGIRKRSGCEYGLSITGVAGPDGGTEEKPVGTVFAAVASSAGVISRKFQLTRDREMNRNRSVYAALELLRRNMLGIE
nr:competence/damage-inducible protein A [candidate division Zixibacteria bacterium]